VNYNTGKVNFTILTDALLAGTETPCLGCGSRFRLGPTAWAMLVGKERIGYLGVCCLAPPAKQLLAQSSERGRVSQ
jgi:hypothetical protein